MGRSKTVFKQVTQVINEDGELLSEDTKQFDVFLKDNDNFYTTHSRLFLNILTLQGNELKILLWCAMFCTVNTNEITFNISIKRRIADNADITVGSVSNALSRLTKRDFIKRTRTGIYIINPAIFWKGNSNLRGKAIQEYINPKPKESE